MSRGYASFEPIVVEHRASLSGLGSVMPPAISVRETADLLRADLARVSPQTGRRLFPVSTLPPPQPCWVPCAPVCAQPAPAATLPSPPPAQPAEVVVSPAAGGVESAPAASVAASALTGEPVYPADAGLVPAADAVVATPAFAAPTPGGLLDSVLSMLPQTRDGWVRFGLALAAIYVAKRVIFGERNS